MQRRGCLEKIIKKLLWMNLLRFTWNQQRSVNAEEFKKKPKFCHHLRLSSDFQINYKSFDNFIINQYKKQISELNFGYFLVFDDVHINKKRNNFRILIKYLIFKFNNNKFG